MLNAVLYSVQSTSSFSVAIGKRLVSIRGCEELRLRQLINIFTKSRPQFAMKRKIEQKIEGAMASGPIVREQQMKASRDKLFRNTKNIFSGSSASMSSGVKRGCELQSKLNLICRAEGARLTSLASCQTQVKSHYHQKFSRLPGGARWRHVYTSFPFVSSWRSASSTPIQR